MICHRCKQPIVDGPWLAVGPKTGPQVGEKLPLHIRCLVEYYEAKCRELSFLLQKTGQMLDDSEAHVRKLMRELGRWSDEDDAILAGSKSKS